jgi:hypothetical protein
MKDKQGYTEFHLELLGNTCEIGIIKRHSTIPDTSSYVSHYKEQGTQKGSKIH